MLLQSLTLKISLKLVYLNLRDQTLNAGVVPRRTANFALHLLPALILSSLTIKVMVLCSELRMRCRVTLM